jgi:hypothetical protein
LLLSGFGCNETPSSEATPTPDQPIVIRAAEGTESPKVAAIDTTAPTTPTAPTKTETPEAPPGKTEEAPTKVDPPVAKEDKTGKTVAKTDMVEAKPASSTPEPEAKKGSDVSGPSFSAWLQTAGAYEAGKPGTVTAVLTARDPYKCNDKYPYKFKFDPPAGGVSYPQETVRGMQIAPKRSTMSIPFVPSQAGAATISGTLYFSVCTDERCLIEQSKLSVSVDVK